MFKKLRDACDEIISAMESEDETATENALGKFINKSGYLIVRRQAGFFNGKF